MATTSSAGQAVKRPLGATPVFSTRRGKAKKPRTIGGPVEVAHGESGGIVYIVKRIRDRRWKNFKTTQHLFEIRFSPPRSGLDPEVLIINCEEAIYKAKKSCFV